MQAVANKASLDVYLSEPGHQGLHLHRLEEWHRRRSASFLLFTPGWASQYLPPEGGYLNVSLLDTQDGKIYRRRIYASYEDGEIEYWAGGTGVNVIHLNAYFYQDHYCACHRKGHAADAGADTDEECEGNRFVVESIEAEDLPGLCLYTELLAVDDGGELT